MLRLLLLRAVIPFFWVILSSAVENNLAPADHLHAECYGVPGKDYGYGNNVKATYGSSPKVLLNVGDQAVDFTLKNHLGNKVTLSELLITKPVVLIWGHSTCPAWQGLNSDTTFPGSSFEAEYEFVDTMSDSVHTIHMISSEPHPSWPYMNFDSGSIRMNLWSTIKQPQNFYERMELSVPPVLKLLHPKAILLVDHLDGAGGRYNNPVWCTYANGARSAVVISMDGRIAFTQDWFSGPDLTDFMNVYLMNR